MTDKNQEIIHYLRLLNFSSEELLDNEKLQELIDHLNEETISRETIVYKPPNPKMNTELVGNKVIKVCRVREEASDFNINGNFVEKNKKKFKFDHVFKSESNRDIYEQMEEFVMSSRMRKSDVAFLFNGYSNSGKTYTWLGDKEDGLLHYLLEKFDNTKIQCLLYEIYNNDIYLYLNGRKIRYVDNVYEECNYFNLEPLKISHIIKNFRSKSDNGINSNSSRSHLIFEMKMFEEDEYMHKITFLDLAGSEKYKYKNDKKLQNETVYINKSLFNVYDYIKTVQKGKKVVSKPKCNLTKSLMQYKNIVFTLLIGASKMGVDAINIMNNISGFLS